MESLHSQVYQFGKLFQDCQAAEEELFREDKVSQLHREVTPLRSYDVPEVLEVHVVPSDEVRMVPELPTVRKVLFPQEIPLSSFGVPEVLEIHEFAVEEVRIVPEEPTITYKQVEQNSIVLSLKAQDSKDGIVAEIPRLLQRLSMLLRITL